MYWRTRERRVCGKPYERTPANCTRRCRRFGIAEALLAASAEARRTTSEPDRRPAVSHWRLQAACLKISNRPILQDPCLVDLDITVLSRSSGTGIKARAECQCH